MQPYRKNSAPPLPGCEVCSLIFDALLKFNDMENYATHQIELRYEYPLKYINFFSVFGGLSRKNEHAQYKEKKEKIRRKKKVYWNFVTISYGKWYTTVVVPGAPRCSWQWNRYIHCVCLALKSVFVFDVETRERSAEMRRKHLSIHSENLSS